MKLVKLTQVVIKMPEMPPEVMQGMTQEELMEQQEIGEDQDFWINPDSVIAAYPNQHPKVPEGSVITINTSPQMPPQIAVREEVADVIKMITEDQ